MKIQQILFPQIGRCTEEELYFRKESDCWPKTQRYEVGKGQTNGEVDPKYVLIRAGELLENRKLVRFDTYAAQLHMDKGGKAWFDTYFNGFSMEKWKKYTILDNLSLHLELSGKVRVTLISEEKLCNDIIRTVLAEYIAEANMPQEFTIDFPTGSGKGMYSFELEALSDDCVLHRGAYTSDILPEKLRSVTVGIGICTFRRETFIEKNLKILRDSILANPDNPMYGHLEVFLSDNGKTLEIDRLQTEHIHIYPNRNLGGAGGFTRDLIEMKKKKEELGITHALLMDDDIVIEPEALVRTWNILSLLKEEYVDTFVGGSMLRLDRQSFQVESGAVWNGGVLYSLKSGLDMRSLDACLYNENEEYVEYNAWWYCCFPMEVVREDNLPLPIFIRGDDLEYGLRNMKNLILMNGICVWHEPFENKYSSYLEYYIIRNQLIDNAFHCQWYGPKQLKKAAMTHCKQEIMFYRYKNVDLYIQGIEDFLKGPRWLMEQDGEELHRQIMASAYKTLDLRELDMPFTYLGFEESIQIQDTKKARVKRLFTLNGLFLPARGEAIVPVANLKSVMFYRKKRVMHYDASSKKAFVTEKSGKASWRCIYKTFKICRKISRELTRAQRMYREQGLELRRLEFWNAYLGLS